MTEASLSAVHATAREGPGSVVQVTLWNSPYLGKFMASELALASASRHEGQSSAIGEALACGLPAVMSDIPGTAGWAEAPNVAAFPSEDVVALAAELERLLASPQQRAALGRENREWVRAHLGMDRWSAEICAVYRPLL